jgi:ParB family chromosome partitioning protein
MATKIHNLKTTQPHFEDIWDGIKRFEVRNNDRNFKVNDILILRDWDDKKNVYLGHRIKARVTYILADFPGIESGYCILGIKNVQRIKEPKQ